MAVDSSHLYWTADFLFASEGQGVTQLTSSKRIFEVTSLALPPYPPQECLVVTKLEPRDHLLFNHSTHSLFLQLPIPRTENCTLPSAHLISLPTPKYKIYFGTVDETGASKCTPDNTDFCKVVSTNENLLSIDGLHAYTVYTVFVTVTNFYRENLIRAPPLVSDAIMLRTGPGGI